MTSAPERGKLKEFPSWGWCALIVYMVIASTVFPAEVTLWALAVGWFVIGGFCLWNFRSCGRIHCSITGPGFIAFGAVTLLGALGLIDIPSWVIWTAFASVMIVGFGLEFRQRKVAGTCYRS